MADSIGLRIAELRRRRSLTQEDLAVKMDVSAQAVSKWENDISCPEVQILVQLAEFFDVTVDELLRGEQPMKTRMVPEGERKPIDQMMLRVIVDTSEGDRVRVNLPVPLIKLALEMGMALPEFNGSDSLKGIDFEALIRLVERGVMGELVSVDSANGDTVSVFVE